MTYAVPDTLKLPIFHNRDPVTQIKVRIRRARWTFGGYNHTNFDLARYHSLREKSNFKFADTARRPDVVTAEH